MDLVQEGPQNLANYAHDALSRKTSLTYLNNAGSGYTYHGDSAIKDIVQGFTGTAADVTYTFGYNKANQVNNRNISNISYVFNGFAEEGITEYDSNGLNQYEETRVAPPPPEGQSVPAPETVVATSYEYDYDNAVGNGNLTSTGRWDYIYDAENRLVQAHDTVGGSAVRFQYDGKGRRIAKLVDDSLGGSFVADKTYEYLYEGDEPIQDLLLVSSSYVVQHRYLHGASVDERLVHWSYDQNTGAEVSERFYHRDHQGSIIAMSDAGGNRPLGELYTYDAYGNMVTGTTSGQPFRYTGRRWDDETGLYYYRARYYSAALGRFLQTDPIGYEDNMNMYGYVGNDPLNNTDPSGLADCGLSIPGECGGGLPEGGDAGDNGGNTNTRASVASSSSNGSSAAQASGAAQGTRGNSGIAAGLRALLLRLNVPARVISTIISIATATQDFQDGPYLHYTSAANAAAIIASGEVRAGPDGYAYATRDVYGDTQTAQQKLALSNQPEGVLFIEQYGSTRPTIGPRPVAPAYNQSGGGTEYLFQGGLFFRPGAYPAGGAIFVPLPPAPKGAK